jgi:signal transduction histidine kinase
MAHEMRGSLNAVLGFSDLLHAEAYGELNPEQQQATADILMAARRLRNLVDRALDIARLETGRLAVRPEVLSVLGTVEMAVADVGQAARDRVIQLQVAVPPDLAIHADEVQTRRVLAELLGNAIKYSAEGCVVSVAAAARGESVHIAVSDHGCGIDPRNLERVFDDFFSLDPSDQPEAGLGLGLALARRLASAMGGDITIASKPGAGTTLTLGLPRCDPPT